MNTRLQVEHPVTEAITGLDLVELQLRAAAGEMLPFTQADLTIDGHAVEARLYAEDPEKEFLPSTGKLWALEFPEGEGIRVDTGVEAGDEVTPYYDPMIAKVIAHGATREEALSKLADALGETVVAGPKTNIAFLKKLCEAEGFREGPFDTGFIDRNMQALGAAPASTDDSVVAAGALYLVERQAEQLMFGPVTRIGDPQSPWSIDDGFQLLGTRETALSLVVDGEPARVRVTWDQAGPSIPSDSGGDRDFTIVEAEDAVIVLHEGRQTRIALHDPFAVDLEHMDEGSVIKAPMHGKVVAVFVQPGDRVEKGQRLAIIEAMKMEHVLTAPFEAEIAEVTAEAGAQVAEGARLIVLKTEDANG
jgi:3-methylcrotonyl-CoA carboxylase alpha subunit